MLRLLTTRPVVAQPRTSSSLNIKQNISIVNHTSTLVSFKQINLSARFFATKQLYVGNIPWSTTENELRDLFAEYGKVHDVRIATDRETGRSKGFAFVTVDSEASGPAASQLDGKAFGGRTLRISEANKQGDSSFGGGPGAGGSRPPREGGFNRGSGERRPPRFQQDQPEQ